MAINLMKNNSKKSVREKKEIIINRHKKIIKVAFHTRQKEPNQRNQILPFQKRKNILKIKNNQ